MDEPITETGDTFEDTTSQEEPAPTEDSIPGGFVPPADGGAEPETLFGPDEGGAVAATGEPPAEVFSAEAPSADEPATAATDDATGGAMGEAADGGYFVAPESGGPPFYEAQPTLLDPEQVGVVTAVVPPAEAAHADDLAGATSVATYGDKDLDTMVAEIAATPAVAGVAAAPGAGGEVAEGGPEATAEPGSEAATSETARAASWPFLVYAGVWAALAVALVFVLRPSAAAGNVFAYQYYRFFLWAGLVLAVVGPGLVLIVWLFERVRLQRGHRSGLFTSALLKGALALFAGVVMWWAAYYAAVALFAAR